MTTLFGLDIAGIINDAIVEAGNVQTGTLRRKRDFYVARERDNELDPSSEHFNLTGSTHAQLQKANEDDVDEYPFNGFIERAAERRRGTSVVMGGEFLSILGASISVEPAIGDVAVIGPESWKITAIDEVDPAKALYKCRVEKCGS